ncbi:Kdo domain containing protein [Gillisia sp. M10.2A]|uniref:Kdo domain containing protein n=1 Tax=Gillisia lutea TaxID=2909668 RepID=A0ABS9EGR8_9FLAO|nr:lipopolysaccharide kinase InaA family protein [Gillisia lutea]MCF4101334.1 Kdo domain containing protein [Gillisia lutea]
MKTVFSEAYLDKREAILGFIQNFESSGAYLNKGDRNSIKIFDLGTKKINIKSFKIPNAVNKFAYRFLRKSKAERSFNYAEILISKNIGTPYPIAYIEKDTALAFKKSYYISEHLECDLTYRELVHDPSFPQREELLRAFTRFTYNLHEEGIEFLDHSPGNTLILLNNGDYQFFLVDLNRMNFKELTFEERMKNFSRLTPYKEMVQIMASEYSQLIDMPEAEVFKKMWGYTVEFQEKFQRKKKLKKQLKFWKK